MAVIAENDGADGVLFEVEGHARGVAGKSQQLSGEGLRQAVDPGDAVADLDHRPDVRCLDRVIEGLDLVL